MMIWMRWIGLCTIGLAAGLFAGLALGAPVETIVGMMLVTPVVLGIAGTMLGASQWLALRRQLPRAAWWIPASGIGLAVGLTAGIVAVEMAGRAITGDQVRLVAIGPLGQAAGMALAGGLGGLGLGIAQWLVLRRHVRRGSLWIVTMTIGLAAGLAGGTVVANVLPGGVASPIGIASMLVTAGLVVGASTGRFVTRIGPAPAAT